MKSYLGFFGFSLVPLALFQRFLFPDVLTFAGHVCLLLSFIFLVYAFSGKNNLCQALGTPFQTQEAGASADLFNAKKKREFPAVLGLSGAGFAPLPQILALFSFLLIMAEGVFLFLLGSKRKNVIQRLCGAAFMLFGTGELFSLLSPFSSSLDMLCALSYLAAFVTLFFMLRRKTSLNFCMRYFLTGLTLIFMTLIVSNILFLSLFASSAPLSTALLQAVTIGTVAILVLLSVPCWLVSQSFAKPLQKLIEYTKSLKEGNLEQLPVTLTTIEYNEILEGLNLMVRAIRRNREDLESQISQLKELDTLREEFLANVSHELRTPLTMIIGNTELILAGLIGDITEEQKEFLQPVYDEAHKLLQLITDVLNFSKIERGESDLYLENINLRKLSQQIIAEFLPLARLRKIKVFNEVPDITFAADSDKFKQIIVHLLSNSLKFNGKEGKIRIKAQILKKSDEDEENQLEVQVADTGIGIRPELLATIFDKFRQGDGSATREHGGTGIGLTIVKSFTELHGGFVYIKSVVGKGTQATVTIPHRELEVEDQSEQPADQTGSSTTKENMLVVLIESDQHISKLLKTYLVQDGYNVLALSSGREALEQIQRLKPNIICLNPVLTDINGWELLKRIKEQSEIAKIPVIIVTVLEKRKLAKKLGANDYIVMPVRKNSFVEIIQKNLSGL